MEQPGVNDASLRVDQPNNDPKTIVKLNGTTCSANTPSGAAWCRKYEHPPAPTPPDYAGIPDFNNSPSVRTEYRAVQDIRTFSTSEGLTTNYDKITFLQLPSTICPAFAYKYAAGSGSRVQLAEDSVLNSSITTRTHLQNFKSSRLAYKSCTYALNATDFNNQGTVTVAQFRPNVSIYPAGVLAERIRASMPRRDAEALIAKLAKSHADDDDIEIISRNTSEKLRVSPKSPSIGDSFIVLNVGAVPSISTQVAQLSPNSTVTPAREGAFVTQRMSQPTTTYHDYPSSAGAAAGVASPIIGRRVLIEEIVGDQTYFQYVNAIMYDTYLEEIDFFDMTCAWVHFEGLSVQPAGSTTTVTPPYITVKAITGLEAQAQINGDFTVFQENCAVPDMKALEFAAITTHAKMDSLPARFNFWGALASGILSAAPSIVSTLKGVFGKKETDAEKARTKETVGDLQRLVDRAVAGNQRRQLRRNPPRRPPPPPRASVRAPKQRVANMVPKRAPPLPPRPPRMQPLLDGGTNTPLSKRWARAPRT